MGSRKQVFAIVAALIAGAASPLLAHVGLDQPNGGETLEAGASTTIQWHVIVSHSTDNWDLWYSLDGPAGPWIPIAVDLPLGDGSTGAAHTFDWTVPDTPSTTVRVRVRQDNFGMDYLDISDGDLSITSDLVFADGFETRALWNWSSEYP